MTDDLVRRLRRAGCVFAEDEARILADAAGSPEELDAMAAARESGRPLEHVVGWAEFCGVRIAVAPGVFVPRRRTEVLVAQAIVVAPERAVVVDLCCGSGAVARVLAERLPEAEVHAADADPDAVRCARGNLDGKGEVYQGDLFEPLPSRLRGRVDVVTANVPYVPSSEVELMPAEAREHEPRLSLDGGHDGLDVLRRVVADAPSWLAPGGCVLSEVSAGQASTAREALTSAGLRARAVTDDDTTVVIGVRYGHAPDAASRSGEDARVVEGAHVVDHGRPDRP